MVEPTENDALTATTGNLDVNGGETEDEVAPPPTPVFITHLIVAIQLLGWPLALIAVHLVVFTNLPSGELSDATEAFLWLRSTIAVGVLVFAFDAWLLRRVAQVLERELTRAEPNGDEMTGQHCFTNTSSIRAAVQVSNQLDRLLGIQRAHSSDSKANSSTSTSPPNPQPPTFILVTLVRIGVGMALTLLGTSCMVGLVMSLPALQRACTATADAPSLSPVTGPPSHIAGIPDALQDWAWRAPGSTHDVHGLSDGTDLFSGTSRDPPNFVPYHKDAWHLQEFQHLAAVPPSQHVRFFAHVRDPRSHFVVHPSETTAAGGKQKPTHRHGNEQYCTIYDDYEASSWSGYGPHNVSILCVEPGESSLDTGIFRNVTVYTAHTVVDPPVRMAQHDGVVWVAVTRRRQFARSRSFYHLQVDSVPLQLVFVTDTAAIENYGGNQIPVVDSSDTPVCFQWMFVANPISLLVSLVLASYWLYRVDKAPTAGVTFVCLVTCFGLTPLPRIFCLAVGSVVVGGAYLYLRGVLPERLVSRMPHSIGREEMIWILYTTLFVLLTNKFDSVLALAACAGMGALLKHPVLYVLSRTVLHWAVCVALVSFWMDDFTTGAFYLCLGTVIQYVLHSHRAYVVYHARRIWSWTGLARSEAKLTFQRCPKHVTLGRQKQNERVSIQDSLSVPRLLVDNRAGQGLVGNRLDLTGH